MKSSVAWISTRTQHESAVIMSKHETPMIRWYWEQIGGTLCEEFRVVRRSHTKGQRLLDAVIVPDGPKKQVHWKELSVSGKDVIVVQAKAKRLGMPLMGQALFSAELMKRLGPRSVRSVALCRLDDEVLRPLLESFPGLEVVVVPPDAGTEMRKRSLETR